MRKPLPFVIGAALAVTPAAAQQRVGTAGAVNPSAQALGSGPSRTINLGSDVIYRERVQTQRTGSVQIVFVDRSTLMIGPNSDVVIDEFVFDPNAGTGRMAVSLARGSLRFLGGQISRTQGAEFRTPVASIGVRGTAATIDLTNGVLTATNISGTMRIRSSDGQTRVITQPGYRVSVTAPPAGSGGGGTAPPRQELTIARATAGDFSTNPTSVPRTALNAPGASVRPTDTTVRNSPLGTTSQSLSPTTIRPVQSASGTPAPVAGRNASVLIDASEAQRATQNAQVTAGIEATVAAPPPVPPPTITPPTITPPAPPPRVVTTAAYALTLNSNLTPVPYIIGGFIASGSVSLTPVMALRTPRPNLDVERSRVLQAGFSLETQVDANGRVQAQSAYLSTLTGNFDYNPATGVGTLDSGFAATTRRTLANNPGFAGGSVTSVPGTVTLDADFLPIGLRFNQDTIAAGSQTISPDNASAYAPGGLPPPNVSYQYNGTGARNNTPRPVGTRDVAPYTGWASGTMRSFEDPTGSLGFVAVADRFRVGRADTAQPGTNLQLTFNPANGTGTGSLRPDNLDPGGGQVFSTGDWVLGRSPDGSRARSSFLDRNSWGLRETRDASNAQLSTSIGDLLQNGTRMQIVPWDTIAQGSPAPTLPNNVVPVSSPHVQWGFWSADTYRPGPSGNRGYSDRTGLNTWVAGDMTSVANMPLSGAATFNGHAVATIRDATRGDFVAAGTMTQSVNFGSGAVTINVPNLDGLSFSGTGTISATDRRFFATTFSATGVTGTTQGAFYGPNANATGGQISFINGTGNYRGAGIMMGVR